jgi:hypothetical protein
MINVRQAGFILRCMMRIGKVKAMFKTLCLIKIDLSFNILISMLVD